MDKLPFTTFDFWGYLASGFLLLCAIDNAGGYGLLAIENWTIVQGVLAVSVAYVAGHIIASVASMILERGFVGSVLGWPSTALFGQSKTPRWLRVLLAFYYAPLPVETRQAILDKAKSSGVAKVGEALFWLAFSRARESDRTMARLGDFLNQYSFCRNVAMVAIADAAILWWAHWQPGGTDLQLVLARLLAAAGLVLVLRYLKFLRHYSLELFTAFAHDETPKSKVP